MERISAAEVDVNAGEGVGPRTHYVSFSAEVNAQTTEVLLAACASLANQETETVHLLLSTPGGRVDNGINAYAVLRGLPFTLVTHNVGSVYSIGNVIFLAGERRYAVPNATFMFHGVGFDVTSPMRVDEKFLRERLGSIEADHERIASILRERASFPDDEDIPALFREEATKNATYALERGIVHEIREFRLPAGAPITQLVFQR